MKNGFTVLIIILVVGLSMFLSIFLAWEVNCLEKSNAQLKERIDQKNTEIFQLKETIEELKKLNN